MYLKIPIRRERRDKFIEEPKNFKIDVKINESFPLKAKEGKKL